jgi:hypothetical protein
MHSILKAKLSGQSDVAGITIVRRGRKADQFVGRWPVPDVKIADRAYFKAFKSDPRSPVADRAGTQPFAGVWTTVLPAR